MKVLLLGSGGREHALAWKIAQSQQLEALYCLPGNPGIAQIANNLPGNPSDFATVREALLAHQIDLLVVGPEEPLVKGIRDKVEADPELAGVGIVGPGELGARLEGSKEFAKAFMQRHNIPTAAYQSFGAEDLEKAQAFLKTLQPPYVLKADGLAAGKGVLILEDYDQACAELQEMFGGKFGAAGSRVVIEEFLSGIEASVFVLTDGKNYLVLPEAKDYKRIGEGDTGLNTGGMGSVSPVPFADAEFMRRVEERIIRPTVEGLVADEIPYKGFIFIGLMNCGGDPYVIEYNVRMGDPETESVMMRIQSDFLGHLAAAAAGTLDRERMEIDPRTALSVILVSGGYPEAYQKGFEIQGADQAVSDAVVFHAGTVLKDEKLLTQGGRVLSCSVQAANIEQAREKAYALAAGISFEGMYYRRDIGNDLL